MSQGRDCQKLAHWWKRKTLARSAGNCDVIVIFADLYLRVTQTTSLSNNTQALVEQWPSVSGWSKVMK